MVSQLEDTMDNFRQLLDKSPVIINLDWTVEQVFGKLSKAKMLRLEGGGELDPRRLREVGEVAGEVHLEGSMLYITPRQLQSKLMAIGDCTGRARRRHSR